jgi:hypothetical protein
VIAAGDVDVVIEQVKDVSGLAAVVIIKGDRIGMWGDVKLVPL